MLFITLEVRLITASSSAVPVIERFPSTVCNTNVPDLVPNFHPSLTACWNGAEQTQQIVDPRRNYETRKEVEIVDVLSALRNWLSNSADEADNVDQNTTDVRCVAAPVETKGEVVRRRLTGSVEITDLVVATTDNVVVADDDTRDGRKKDRVGRQVGSEIIGCGEESPRQS